MNILDVCIILLLGLGAVTGFKRGFIKSGVTFVGTLLIIVIAYYLKNPVSIFLYKLLPFFNLSGIFKGVTVLNILIYEAIAFLLVMAVLSIILTTIIKITGVIEKIMNFTIILGIPSKILGMIFGFFQYFIYVFIILFVFSQFNITREFVSESDMATKILTKTPALSNIVGNAYNSVEEIVSLAKVNEDKNQVNRQSLDILLKYKIISTNNAEYLIDKGKIKIDNKDEILNKYKEA